MTNKTNKKAVKNAQKQAIKGSKVSDNTQTSTKWENVINDFFSGLKSQMDKAVQELGLRVDKPCDYYVVFSGINDDGRLTIKSTTIGTNLNPYAPTGIGMKMLAKDLEKTYNLKNVSIINLIKLG